MVVVVVVVAQLRVAVLQRVRSAMCSSGGAVEDGCALACTLSPVRGNRRDSCTRWNRSAPCEATGGTDV